MLDSSHRMGKSTYKHEHNHPTIGVLAGWQVYGGTLHSFFAPVFDGIRSAAHERQCNLLLACGVDHSVNNNLPLPLCPAWPVLSPKVDFVPVGPWNTDGLLVITPLTQARSRDVQRIVADGHPVVFSGAGGSGPAVVGDNEGGIRQALAHLVEHGHRHVAFIAGEKDTSADATTAGALRVKAYRAAVREYGLEENPDLIVIGHHNFAGGRSAMRQLLDSQVRFTAVLASNDESALGAMQTLDEAGLRVPDDVAVIGFDDRLESMAHTPSLTTVHYPSFEVGRRALELLLEYIEGRAEVAESIRVPTKLVVRESCGCLPASMTQTIFGRAKPPSHPDPGPAVARELPRAMAATTLGEAHHLKPDEVHALCGQLVEAFVIVLERGGDGDHFRSVLQKALRRTEAAGDNLNIWENALSVLGDGIPFLTQTRPRPDALYRAEKLLRQAHIIINAGTRRQHARYVIQRSVADDRAGRMVAQLLATMDEQEAMRILAEHLPEIGIRRADVALFEPQGDDPVAWSVLVGDPGAGVPRRFPSREFPPEGLYPPDRPFDLALLPLVIEEKAKGFVSFTANDLGPCATIVRQLASVFRSIHLYREAVEGRQLAEEANRLKSRFLSTVSHELRTPLSLILGLSDMLLEEQGKIVPPLPEQVRQDVERIHAGARHLDGLVGDVLDLARSEAGQLRLVCEPLDLAEVAQPVVVFGEQMTKDKKLAWRVEIAEDLPPVWGDQARIRQVVMNLVSNAIKFTAEGEVVLRINEATDQQAPTHPSADARYVTVSVSDTGLGIPPEEQEVIFDEFHQSERTAERGYGGLGLGLAICRRLVEMHGGKLSVQSSGREGEGSTFSFTLPVMEEVEGHSGTEGREGRKQTVLLLAERTGVEERVQEYLARQGFEVEVLWVNETTEWLSQLLAAPPGAVVLDFLPASKRGWEVLKILKGNPATQDIPVLFYALEGEADSGAVLELDYLTKPIGTAALARALERQGLGRASGSGKRMRTVLVVDDEPGVLEMHARIVRAQLPECRVLKARNGREALDVIRQELPDLVLLDLMMPELDGFGVLEAMQEGQTTRDIPVIVLTAQVLTGEDMERLNRGVAAVLGKGLFSAEETLAQVEAALAHKRNLGSARQRIVRKAMTYLHEHYMEPFSRQDVADYVGVSKSYLSRCFHEETGLSPTTYLNRYRVRHAKALLDEDKSITEVALAVGFSSAAHFSRIFRRETGMTPSDYRQGRSSS